MNFTNQDQKQLEKHLDESKYPEVLNFSSIHGFICGIISGPITIDEKTLSNQIFFNENAALTEIDPEAISLINSLYQSIEQVMFSSSTLLLPCNLELEYFEENGAESDEEQIVIPESLSDWTIGFFEAHLINEEIWYKNEEDLVAEMLLPIMLCIEEIEDESLDSIREDAELFQGLVNQIPQALQDLYLFYHANEK